MVTITSTYLGDLRCESIHEPSGNRLLTDAPKDNHGKGEAFSPTDLVATALATCILTVMGITAKKLQIDMSGASLSIVKEMVAQPIRRIGKLTVQLHMPPIADAAHQQALMNAAYTCPVKQSLHPDITIDIAFIWG